MLKNSKDIRAVIFMILTTAIFFSLWNYGPNLFNDGSQMNKWAFRGLYALFLLLSVIVSVITHNHNHVAMWKSRAMNIFQENWLTVFYGFPIFSWIPTHNTNHHTHTNTDEDHTKTWRYSDKNNIFTLLSYPSVSAKFQVGVVAAYYKGMYNISRKKFWFHTLQLVSLVVWVAVFFILDWKKAVIYVLIPQQFSQFSVLIFNYLQHVHADEDHKYNNSRNFTGKVVNFFLLNNGIHLAHHMHPSQHWSELPEAHKAIEHEIDPSLNEKSYWGYLFRTYIASIFIPKYRSKTMKTHHN